MSHVIPSIKTSALEILLYEVRKYLIYEGWNFNSGNYLFTTDTK